MLTHLTFSKGLSLSSDCILPTYLTHFCRAGRQKKKSWICADKSLKSLSYSVPHLFLWQPCSIGSNHMGKWSMQKLSNLSKDIQLDVLHTKQTALSWNVIDYLGGGRWGGTISPIRNKIEKYIPFVSCHKKPWKERRSSKCSDLDPWKKHGLSWVFLLDAPPGSPATREFPVFLSVSRVWTILFVYEPPMPGT